MQQHAATPPRQRWPPGPTRRTSSTKSSASRAVRRPSRINLFRGRACETLLRVAGDLQVSCRIDYHLATPAIAKLAKTEHIYLEQRFSDHAPLTIDYDFSL